MITTLFISIQNGTCSFCAVQTNENLSKQSAIKLDFKHLRSSILVLTHLQELSSIAGVSDGELPCAETRYSRISNKVQALYVTNCKRETGVLDKLQTVYSSYAGIYAKYAGKLLLTLAWTKLRTTQNIFINL